MDFAANAVPNIAPPPPRSGSAPSSASDEDASFADHLATANPEPVEPAESKETHEPGDTSPGENAAAAVAPAPQAPIVATPAPFLMHLADSLPEAQIPQAIAANDGANLVAPPPERQPAVTAPQDQAPSQSAPHAPPEMKSKTAPRAAAAPLASPTADSKAIEAASAPQPAPAQAASSTSAPAPTQFNPTVAAAVAAINAVTQQSTSQQRIARAAAATKSAPAEQAPAASLTAQQPAAAKAAPPKSAIDRLQLALKGAPLPAQQLPAPEAQQQGGSIQTMTTHASSHSNEAAAEQGAARALPAAQQVAREITRRFDGGSTRFELRLDPPELGRVEVRLDVSRDHRVTAVIAADNPQSLMELARHARELEQQLQSAGLALSENGLSFDLRQGERGSEDAAGDSALRGGPMRELEAEEQATLARPIGFERWRGVRVDLMV